MGASLLGMMMVGLLASGCREKAPPPTPEPVRRANQAQMAQEAAQAAKRAMERERNGPMVEEPEPVADDAPSGPGVSLPSGTEAADALRAAIDRKDVLAASALVDQVAREGRHGADQVALARRKASALEKGLRELYVYESARWLQGRADSRGLDLVVFWEPWCPNCRKHVPRLQGIADLLGPKGLEVVGLTTLSRGANDAQAAAFLEEEHIRFDIAVVPSRNTTRAGVTSIPKAFVIEDGKVLWSGHPKDLVASYVEARLAK